jgi:hypothetical protein
MKSLNKQINVTVITEPTLPVSDQRMLRWSKGGMVRGKHIKLSLSMLIFIIYLHL